MQAPIFTPLSPLHLFARFARLPYGPMPAPAPRDTPIFLSRS